MAANSGTQVLASIAMSGVASATYAVRSFSCAADHGICCTSTFTPGCAFSNAGMSWDTTSPSRPIAHSRSLISFDDDGAHETAAAITTARAAPASVRPRALTIKPPAGESGFLQAGDDVLVLPHRLPHQIGPVILDHCDDRPLVDAQIIGVEPADSGNDVAVMRVDVDVERRVERIDETVWPENIVAIF